MKLSNLLLLFFSTFLFYTDLYGQIQDFRPVESSEVGMYAKFEVEIRITDLAFSEIENPYNPSEVNIVAYFTSPSGSTFKRNGFFMDRQERITEPPFWQAVEDLYPFKVRFAPHETGQWQYALEYYANGALITTTSNKTFECIKSNNPGFLNVSDNNRYLEFSNGDSFFGIAEDLRSVDNRGPLHPDECNSEFQGRCSPSTKWCYSDQTLVKNLEYMRNFKNQGGNMVRIWIEPFSYEFEWETLGDYSSRQNRAHDLDLLIAEAEKLGLYIHLVLRNIGSLKNDNECNYVVGCWDSSPYKIELNLNTKDEFFKDESARDFYKRRLQYLHSRWAYSTAVASYGLFNEVDLEADLYFNSDHQSDIHDWFLKTAEFLKVLDYRCPLISAEMGFAFKSSDVLYESEYIDLVTRHGYSFEKNVEYQRSYVAQDRLKRYNKPFSVNEFGFGLSNNGIQSCWIAHLGYTSDTRLTHTHNSIWSTSFSGSYSNYFFFASHDKYHSPCWGRDKIRLYAPISHFFEGEKFNEESNPYTPIGNALSYYNTYNPAPLNDALLYGDLPIIDVYGMGERFDANPFDEANLVNGIATTNERNIQVFGLKKNDKILGWIGNKNHYWFNVHSSVSPGCDSPNPSTSNVDFDNPNTSATHSSDYTPLVGEQMTISNVHCNGRYAVKWFSAHYGQDIDNDGVEDDGGEIPSLAATAMATNSIMTIDIPNLQALNIEAPYGPDYGFKIELLEIDSTGCMESNSNGAELNDLRIFPNPIQGNSFNIEMNLVEDSKVSIDLVNLSGKVVSEIYREHSIDRGIYIQKVDLNNAPAGMYILRCRINNININRKFIKVD